MFQNDFSVRSFDIIISGIVPGVDNEHDRKTVLHPSTFILLSMLTANFSNRERGSGLDLSIPLDLSFLSNQHQFRILFRWRKFRRWN